ncbi:MAG: hypothetical protein HWE22_17430 [Flavobacteriales bacterium]|nr:hypothetical protein [Flavobacteriales bacterium]
MNEVGVLNGRVRLMSGWNENFLSLIPDPTVEKYKHRKGNTKLYSKAMYTIFKAMKGHRIFERFGFSNPNPKQAPSGAKAVIDFDLWTYNLKTTRLGEQRHGRNSNGLHAPAELLDVFLNRVDSELD